MAAEEQRKADRDGRRGVDLNLIITAAGVLVALFIGGMQVYIAGRQSELSRLQGELQTQQAQIQTVSSWLPFLTHDDPNVRLAAVIALGQIEADTAIAPLVTALTDDEPGIRERAGQGLARLATEDNARRIADIVVSVFERLDRTKTQAALDTLVAIGVPALDYIQAALHRLAPEARRRAEQAIERILLNERVLNRLGVLKAHEITLGAPEITLALVGGGVDASLPDIAKALKAEFNHLGDDGEPFFSTTWAARLIVGQPGSEVVGVAPGIQLLSERAIGKTGGSYAVVAAALRHAVEAGAKVIYLELGGTAYAEELQQAIDAAHEAGAIVVAAAGNAGDEAKWYPAAMDHVIAVAATDANERKAPYSSYGDWVDIAAPGNPLAGQEAALDRTGGVQTLQGTSFAGSLVAGAMALVWSVDPAMPAEEVRRHVLETAADLAASDPAHAGKLGSGRLDVLAAVRRAAASRDTATAR